MPEFGRNLVEAEGHLALNSKPSWPTFSDKVASVRTQFLKWLIYWKQLVSLVIIGNRVHVITLLLILLPRSNIEIRIDTKPSSTFRFLELTRNVTYM